MSPETTGRVEDLYSAKFPQCAHVNNISVYIPLVLPSLILVKSILVTDTPYNSYSYLQRRDVAAIFDAPRGASNNPHDAAIRPLSQSIITAASSERETFVAMSHDQWEFGELAYINPLVF